jgi:hypothetical protein
VSLQFVSRYCLKKKKPPNLRVYKAKETYQSLQENTLKHLSPLPPLEDILDSKEALENSHPKCWVHLGPHLEITFV